MVKSKACKTSELITPKKWGHGIFASCDKINTFFGLWERESSRISLNNYKLWWSECPWGNCMPACLFFTNLPQTKYRLVSVSRVHKSYDLQQKFGELIKCPACPRNLNNLYDNNYGLSEFFSFTEVYHLSMIVISVKSNVQSPTTTAQTFIAPHFAKGIYIIYCWSLVDDWCYAETDSMTRFILEQRNVKAGSQSQYRKSGESQFVPSL